MVFFKAFLRDMSVESTWVGVGWAMTQYELWVGKADQTIDMQNTQTLAKHTRDTVEILVSPIKISRNLGTFDPTLITTSSNLIVYLDSTSQKSRQRGIFCFYFTRARVTLTIAQLSLVCVKMVVKICKCFIW